MPNELQIKMHEMMHILAANNSRIPPTKTVTAAYDQIIKNNNNNKKLQKAMIYIRTLDTFSSMKLVEFRIEDSTSSSYALGRTQSKTHVVHKFSQNHEQIFNSFSKNGG